MGIDYMVWNESYSIGYNHADDQHKDIIRIINKIHQNKQSNDPTKLFDSLNELNDYAYKHFMMEELIMRKSGYPRLERHREQHNKFKEYLNDIQFKHRNNMELLYEELLEYLKSWWENHIQTADRAYVPYANKCRNC